MNRCERFEYGGCGYMQQVNFNLNGILSPSSFGFSAPIHGGQNVNSMLSELFGSMSKMFEMFGAQQFGSGGCIPPGGCTSPPVIEDSCHPSGSLKTANGKIETPGGYTVEPLGRFEWKITGPDGKTTRVWGDPHVAEGDGGKWDFKRDSTFVLPDGTRINVTTKPWGNGGMTVTSGLEIINGNDRVVVSGIDAGKGVIGPVTRDGFRHVNNFGGRDVFVMGRETDDWSYNGREIIGSNNGGASFRLGNELAPGRPNSNDSIMEFLRQLFGDWDPNWRPNDFGSNPYYQPVFGPDRSTSPRYDMDRHQECMSDVFRDLSRMFDTLSRMTNMNETFYANRNRSVMV